MMLSVLGLIMQAAEAGKVDWAKVVETALIVMAAAVTGGGLVWKAVKSVRENARKAKTQEVAERDKLIAEAVEKKRLEMQGVIDRAQQTADLAQKASENWKSMAELSELGKNRAAEEHREEMAALRVEMERLRAERNKALEDLEAAKAKVEQVVDFNLGLQGQVQSNTQELKKLRDEVAAKN